MDKLDPCLVSGKRGIDLDTKYNLAGRYFKLPRDYVPKTRDVQLSIPVAGTRVT